MATAIKIIGITPKQTPRPADPVQAHLSIESFQWTVEQTLQTGTSTRASMFDWIVNKGGKAFMKKGEKIIPIFGANSAAGQYVRTLEDGKWGDDLLDLPEFIK